VFGLETQLAEEIECDDGNGNEAIPLGGRVAGGSGVPDGNEVFLEGTDGVLDRVVAAVGVGGSELEVIAMGAQEGLELVGGFIVKALVPGWKTFCREFGVDCLVGAEERGARAIEEGLSEDEIAVMVVGDHDVAIAGGRGDKVGAGLVRGEGAGGDGNGPEEHNVGALAFIIFAESRVSIRCYDVSWWILS
jgi:hypothetical protein